MVGIRRRWSSAGRPVPVCRASHGLSSLTTKPTSPDIPGRRIGLRSVMISRGGGEGSRLAWPPLPLLRWRRICVAIPLDLGRPQSDHVHRYDLSGGGTGSGRCLCPRPAATRLCDILWSSGSGIRRLAYLALHQCGKSRLVFPKSAMLSKEKAKKWKKPPRLVSPRFNNRGPRRSQEPEKQCREMQPDRLEPLGPRDVVGQLHADPRSSFRATPP